MDVNSGLWRVEMPSFRKIRPISYTFSKPPTCLVNVVRRSNSCFSSLANHIIQCPHHHTLQMKFSCNSKEKVPAQRIVKSHKWSGISSSCSPLKKWAKLLVQPMQANKVLYCIRMTKYSTVRLSQPTCSTGVSISKYPRLSMCFRISDTICTIQDEQHHQLHTACWYPLPKCMGSTWKRVGASRQEANFCTWSKDSCYFRVDNHIYIPTYSEPQLSSRTWWQEAPEIPSRASKTPKYTLFTFVDSAFQCPSGHATCPAVAAVIW